MRLVVSGQWQVARANRHWTDEECDARLMGYLHDDARSCARWRTVLGGLGLSALGAVLIVLVMSW
jgi:hypothetical protein